MTNTKLPVKTENVLLKRFLCTQVGAVQWLFGTPGCRLEKGSLIPGLEAPRMSVLSQHCSSVEGKYSPKENGTHGHKQFNVSTQNVFVRNKITKQLSWIIAIHFAAVLSNGRAMKMGWDRAVYRTCTVPADCLPCHWLLTSHGRRYAMTLMQNLKLSILAYLSY